MIFFFSHRIWTPRETFISVVFWAKRLRIGKLINYCPQVWSKMARAVRVKKLIEIEAYSARSDRIRTKNHWTHVQVAGFYMKLAIPEDIRNNAINQGFF